MYICIVKSCNVYTLTFDQHPKFEAVPLWDFQLPVLN